MNSLFYKKWYDVPAEWNELTAKQLERVTRVLWSETSEDAGRFKIFLILLNWSVWKIVVVMGLHRFANLRKVARNYNVPMKLGDYIDRTERLADACQQFTQFIFEANTLTVNPFRYYRKHQGPNDELSDFTIKQFAFAEFFFTEWKNDPAVGPLNKLVEILYPTAAKEIPKWPFAVKAAIAFFYEGCRIKKVTEYAEVFGGTDEEQSGDNPFGMWGVMRAIAKAGHLGDLGKVEGQLLDTILMEMEMQLIEAKKQEEQLEKLRQNDR